MSFELDIGAVLRWALFAPALSLVVLILGFAFLHWTTGEPLQHIADALARVFEARRTVVGPLGVRGPGSPGATPTETAEGDSAARPLGSAGEPAPE